MNHTMAKAMFPNVLFLLMLPRLSSSLVSCEQACRFCQEYPAPNDAIQEVYCSMCTECRRKDDTSKPVFPEPRFLKPDTLDTPALKRRSIDLEKQLPKHDSDEFLEYKSTETRMSRYGRGITDRRELDDRNGKDDRMYEREAFTNGYRGDERANGNHFEEETAGRKNMPHGCANIARCIRRGNPTNMDPYVADGCPTPKYCDEFTSSTQTIIRSTWKTSKMTIVCRLRETCPPPPFCDQPSTVRPQQSACCPATCIERPPQSGCNTDPCANPSGADHLDPSGRPVVYVAYPKTKGGYLLIGIPKRQSNSILRLY